MSGKEKPFNQIDAIQIYKTIIGTLVLIGIMFIGWGVDKMITQNQQMYDNIQEQGKLDTAMLKDLYYMKRDIKIVRKQVDQNIVSINKIKLKLK